ncbi:MAG TPA: LPS export ABC transporter periplasmic protein LptC [Candidatus Accumulibacter phosphatis]|nr:MAG: lipopolysaccharide exporter periplasmic protein [Candidatus Accumulibacter sp. SK-11]HAY28418.1 LPS export ABC transporter periplasmic protein LptC [Accumulibacter sp.]HRL78026.1 LPS export ABC transporter periplasmic protein LptC [Candidatus Accumulibacter phosphatis]HCN69853.1 LPS export ABC transporter periplasmic protein LptC [Accumulibacter sp.]HCV12425.1 LPS export ABC transporter periplasmic protein LptC [Accumulibacter sp.]
MKKWSSAALPLTIMLVLVALSAWLRYATGLPDAARDGRNRHEPDAILSEVHGHKLDANGALLYTIVADEIRHYPDDETNELLQPRLAYVSPRKPTVTIRANEARASAKAEKVDLSGQVEIRRAAGGSQAELLAEMPELTVLTEEKRAFTRSKVLITQGPSRVQGVGMQVDHSLQTYVLESQVSGEIESPFARKKKPKT